MLDDISRSFFEAYVERLDPGSRVEVVTSTLGAAGCWWYREVEASTGIPRVETWGTTTPPTS
jgi:hypothetical protein